MKIYRIYGSIVILTDGYIRARNKKEAKEKYRKLGQENENVNGEFFVDDVLIEGSEEDLPKNLLANGDSEGFYALGFKEDKENK